MKTAKSAPDFTSCEHWGQGGQYVFDPASGKRTRVDAPTEPTEATTEPAATELVTGDQVAEQSADNKKGKPRG